MIKGDVKTFKKLHTKRGYVGEIGKKSASASFEKKQETGRGERGRRERRRGREGAWA